jgi:ABC-2 type transport system ATP-binding protein
MDSHQMKSGAMSKLSSVSALKRFVVLIETHGLTKEYRSSFAVRDLDLAVTEGSISALLGPNGSGKTTTLRMLLGLARPSAGNGLVFGQAISDDAASVKIRKRTGYVGEDKRLYGYMTVQQILGFVRSVYPTWKLDRERTLLKQFDLPLNRKCKQLSKGMRTKLALVLALSRGAELLIFDEPSEGLDPGAAEQLLEAMVQAAADGVTVFFSTQQISEAERVADQVFIMNRGQLVFQTAIEDLREKYRRMHFAFPCRAPKEQMNLAGVQKLRAEGHVLSIVANGNIERIRQHGQTLGAISINVQPISLREAFLESLEEDHS